MFVHGFSQIPPYIPHHHGLLGGTLLLLDALLYLLNQFDGRSHDGSLTANVGVIETVEVLQVVGLSLFGEGVILWQLVVHLVLLLPV